MYPFLAETVVEHVEGVKEASATLTATAMSELISGYSSGEDDDNTNDVFGLSAIHAAKKQRVEQEAQATATSAAPDVLAEVRQTVQRTRTVLIHVHRTP